MKRALIPFLIFSAFAYAADEPVVMGWTNKANAGANLSFSSSKDVVGQTDGNSETYGLNVKGEFFRNLPHSEWRTDASVVASTTRTPSLDGFIKSSDELKVSTQYTHFWHGNRYVGPYARGEASAPMFKGEDVQSTVKTYNVSRADGTPLKTLSAQSYRLTDGFKPLNTKESIGVFWKPVHEENIKVETRLGLAGLQIDADGQYTVKSQDATTVAVTELGDVNQFGAEAAVAVKGKVDEKSGYEAGVEAMTPFTTNKKAGDNRDNLRLTNIDGYVKLTSKFTSWASFGYDYKVKYQPQLIEKAQQIHMLVLTMNYNIL
jgi:hypothetical protein